MTSRWSRLRLTLPSSYVDWISAEAVEWGSPGVEVVGPPEECSGDSNQQLTLDIYFPEETIEDSRRKIKDFLERLGPQATPYFLGAAELTPPVDWAEQWRYHFPPLAIGEHILVLPPWEEGMNHGSRHPILLQPGMAFGTGHHPTTALIIECLESQGNLDEIGTILDIGCGSGILGITAVMLGVSRSLAIDYDRDAVMAARSNVERNNLQERVYIVQALFPQLPVRGTFRLVLANVYYTFFQRHAESLAKLVTEGGILLASGIQKDETGVVVDMLAEVGFETRVSGEREGWVVLEGQRI